MIEINERTYWKFTQLHDGRIHLVRRINIKGKLNLQDVTGPFWIFGKLKIAKGTFRYKQDSDLIDPRTKEWGFILPPFSLMQAHGQDAELIGEMIIYDSIGFSQRTEKQLARYFPIEASTQLSKDNWLRNTSGITIARSLSPLPLADRTKTLVDRTYRSTMSLGEVATRLRTNPASLSRAFKATFGMTLVEYRTWLRVMVATQALLKEQSITDVFQDVGFQDLGRFYKQFKHVTSVPPGRYKKRKSKNAKK